MFNVIQGSVACYARVSTEEQAERGSIQSQIDFATKYCEMYGLNLYKIYKDEGISGTIPFEERPSSAELLTDAKDGKFDTLLVFKLDRLGRSTRIIINTIYDLEQMGIKLKSMTEPFDTADPSGRFLLTILAGVADLERSNILQRMWLGANRAAKEGKWLGGIVPYGYYVGTDGKLVINDEIIPSINMSEADVVHLMFDFVASGKSLIACAAYLNSLGIPTHYNLHGHTGKRVKSTAGIWRPARVGNVIRNTIYKGIHYYGKRTDKKRELIPRSTPAIVSEEIWAKAQEVVRKNFITSKRSTKYEYLLKGLIKCENCGSNYHGSTFKNSDKQKYYVCNRRTNYKTHGVEKCIGKYIDMPWLDELVWNTCLYYVNTPEVVLQEIKKQSNHLDVDGLSKEMNKINLQLASKETDKDNILTLFRKSLISLAEVEKQLKEVDKEKSVLSDRLNEIKAKLASTEVAFATEDNALKLFSKLQELLKTKEADFYTKRDIITMLVDKIYIKTEIVDEEEKATVKIRFKFSPNNPRSVTTLPSYEPQGQSFSLQFDKVFITQPKQPTVKLTGNRVQKARLDANITLKELADKTTLLLKTIIAVESNVRKVELCVAKKYSIFFGMPVGYFLEADKLPSDTLPQKIKKARLMAGLTQKELAEKLGFTEWTVRNWENERSQPLKELTSLISFINEWLYKI